MKFNPTLTKLQKKILSNEEQILDQGLTQDALIQLRRDLSLSPIGNGRVAEKHVRLLSEYLNRNLVQQTLNPQANQHIPDLDPDSSLLLGHMDDHRAVRISINILTMHILIGGSTGFGKTTLLYLFILFFMTRTKIILFDHKDEHLKFSRKINGAVNAPLSAQRWNCLKGCGNQDDYIRFLSPQIARALNLLPVTGLALHGQLAQLCANGNDLPAFSDLPPLFRKLGEVDKRSSLLTASRSLNDWINLMGDWAKVRSGHWPFDDSALTIIPMKDVPASLEYFYVSLLFKQLTDRASQSGHSQALKRLIIFDEGRVFFGREFEAGKGSGHSNVQTEMVTKGRSYGEGFIVATQDMAAMQPSVINNTATFISFHTNSPKEARLFCRRHGMHEKYYRKFMELPKGRVVMSSPEYPQPVEFQIPFNDLGDYPGESEIAERMAPVWNQWNAHAVFSPMDENAPEPVNFHELLGECESDPQVDTDSSTAVAPVVPLTKPEKVSDRSSPSDPTILSEYFELMRSCRKHPETGVTAHYTRLGWSAGRGHRIKTALIEKGWIKMKRITSQKGGRPREVPQLTSLGEKVLNESA